MLAGLRRLLYPTRHEWELLFATSGPQALEIMARQPVEVLITDMRMPGMDGAELLRKVIEQHPGVIRIILSGHSEQEALFRALGPAHIYLSKPCDGETLRAVLARALALRQLLTDADLRRLVAQIDRLPSMPELYVEILRALERPDVSPRHIGEIIAQDIAMTAKLLQIVNSAFFGLRQHVTDPVQAVILLGLEAIRVLVLSAHVFSQITPAQLRAFRLDTLWAHSMAVGMAARRIAMAQRLAPEVVEQAALTGLLHDIGKLILAANLPEKYSLVLEHAQEEHVSHVNAEDHVLGSTHAELGAYLLGLWGLPDSIVVAIARHHIPQGNGFEALLPMLGAVHIADWFHHATKPLPGPYPPPPLDESLVARLGLTEALQVWLDSGEITEAISETCEGRV
ncbi:MAG: response regulator [Anaerolineae bacterium]